MRRLLHAVVAVGAWVDPTRADGTAAHDSGTAVEDVGGAPNQAVPWPWEPSARCYLAKMHEAEVTPRKTHCIPAGMRAPFEFCAHFCFGGCAGAGGGLRSRASLRSRSRRCRWSASPSGSRTS